MDPGNIAELLVVFGPESFHPGKLDSCVCLCSHAYRYPERVTGSFLMEEALGLGRVPVACSADLGLLSPCCDTGTVFGFPRLGRLPSFVLLLPFFVLI